MLFSRIYFLPDHLWGLVTRLAILSYDKTWKLTKLLSPFVPLVAIIMLTCYLLYVKIPTIYVKIDIQL